MPNKPTNPSSNSPSINAEFIERYQLEYEKNPKSKVFAPLAEAYRKMGLIDEALSICRRGVMIHPDFASGRVAFAKALLEKKAYAEALTQLEKAIQLSPDNLLAHSLTGETLLEMRKPKAALKAFKMVLFLNPDDARARQAVAKWEFLTADEYDEEVFQMKPLFKAEAKDLDGDEEDKDLDESPLAPESVKLDLAALNREIERALSLADAFTVRGSVDAAINVLENAIRRFGPHAELQKRLKLLTRRNDWTAPPEEDDNPAEGSDSLEGPRSKRLLLETLLQRINDRRLG
jgi:tetratricopeptide (TPR) repeat protein